MDETLAGLVAGDPAAYARLWDRLGGRLFATARLLTGSVPEAEDSVHDLFVALARSRQGLAGVVDLDAYLFAALRHTVARRRKQAAARRATLEHLRQRVEETSGPHGPFGLPAEDPDERLAAAVARLPGVRAVLVSRQRDIGAHGAIVMEGRDIGTVVFPAADVKIYLDASPDERARRRAHDPAHTGGPSAVEEVASALTARDEIDRTRTASPLYAAKDAVLLDTTGQSIDDVVAQVLTLVDAVDRT